MDNEDVDKTAFLTHHRLFRYTRIPFGAKNAPETFQRVMFVILTSIDCQFAITYFDDIIIFSESPQKHLDHTKKFLRLLNDGVMTLK